MIDVSERPLESEKELKWYLRRNHPYHSTHKIMAVQWH